MPTTPDASTNLINSTPITLLPIHQIIIPDNRQRENAKADELLITSIRDQGLLNPIIVRADHTLVAGERRLSACRELGFTHIPARIFEHLTPLAAHLVELQENLARNQLTWQEETSAIADYHSLRLEAFPGWTQLGTAQDLGVSEARVSRTLAVARHLTDPEVRGALSFKGALNLIETRANRTLAAAQARGLITSDTIAAAPPPDATKEERTQFFISNLSTGLKAAAASTGTILEKLERSEDAKAKLDAALEIERDATPDDDRVLEADFETFVATYTGAPFDVLHCDFPYGKNYSGSRTRKTGAATTLPTYADGADIYFSLVDALLTHQDRILLPQAHCIFWMDMIHYCWTVEQFTQRGWRLVQPHPLVWTKGYQGVAADTQRRPRHCYETALFFSRGDRKIRKLEKDHFDHLVDEKLHISQKPIKMLRHFLSLVVDEHTAVLDPTCGSGTALVAASQLKAARVLGVELEPAHCDIARFMLKKELNQPDLLANL